MAYEQKNNSGTLFKNDRKTNDRQPDYTGSALIDGVEKRLSAWIKEVKGGKKLLSLSFQDPQPSGGSGYGNNERRETPPVERGEESQEQQFSESDIPF